MLVIFHSVCRKRLQLEAESHNMCRVRWENVQLSKGKQKKKKNVCVLTKIKAYVFNSAERFRTI